MSLLLIYTRLKVAKKKTRKTHSSDAARTVYFFLSPIVRNIYIYKMSNKGIYNITVKFRNNNNNSGRTGEEMVVKSSSPSGRVISFRNSNNIIICITKKHDRHLLNNNL